MNYINAILQVFRDYSFLSGTVGGIVSNWLFTKYRISTQSIANITEEQLKKEIEKNY